MLVIKFKAVLRRSFILIYLRLSMRGEDAKKYLVQKGFTDICIDGYPRSANSFAVRMFKQANPDAHIAHHTHSISNLKKAINCNVPVIVLIRDPKESIVSSVIAHKKNNIDEEVYRYIEFYSWVYEKIEKLVIADFKQVTSDFNQVILAINNRSNSKFLFLNDVEKACDNVKNDIEARYDRIGQEGMQHIKPVPTQSRNIEKDKYMAIVLNHRNFNEAEKLYNKFIKYMQLNPYNKHMIFDDAA